MSKYELKIAKMNSAFFLVLKSPLYYTNRVVSITVFSDTLIHNIGYIFEYHILTLIFRLDTKLHCLFLQITSEMTNKNLTILLIDNLFFGFSAYKSYSLKLMHTKLYLPGSSQSNQLLIYLPISFSLIQPLNH